MIATDADIRRWEPLCIAIVKKRYLPGGDFDDLMQEARLGVALAVEGFKGDQGSSLQTFVALVVQRKVDSVVRSANYGKHRPLSESVRVVKTPEGEVNPAAEMLEAPETDAPLASLLATEELHELAEALRERLSDTECAVAIGRFNGLSYEQIAERLDTDKKSIDNALQRVQVKLGLREPIEGSISTETRRRGECGYCCPGCGGATVKKRGRGRPPRCNVCRVKAKVAA